MHESSKKIFIYTIGCQMNVYDSDRMIGGLVPSGYRPTTSPEQADLILVNTCSIRAKAEQKAFSFLGRLSGLKQNKPGLIIGVAGCVAQQAGEKIFKRMPHVDLVLGTQAVGRLPAIIRKIETKRCRVVDVAMEAGRPAEGLEAHRPVSTPSITRFVTIMRGCDNYCTYCVVPYVRGRETSRQPEDIVNEIDMLVSSGVREVTLLGQNVNSYGQKEGLCSFTELLARVNTVAGLHRIRFTTSHPKDLSDDLMRAYGSLTKLCRHIHLPVQSGADCILARMNRNYTRSGYLDKVAQLRDRCPEIEITTDIIVGFPGETEQDFDATLDLIRRVAYDGLFAFNYSDRPQTPAAHFSGKIPEAESNRRLQAVLALQEKIARTKNKGMVDTVQRVLVEGFSKKQDTRESSSVEDAIEWTGRTFGQKIVNFTSPVDPTGRRIVPGDLVNVKIERALSHSLGGRAVLPERAAGDLEGENSYAA